MKYDCIIVGGSLGGVFASIALAREQKKCLILEEYDWIGGQLTSQAVPPDEHPKIEEYGCTATYREMRNRIREHYRNQPEFKSEVKQTPSFNPGGGWVSLLCHEPRIAHQVLCDMIRPYCRMGLITVITKAKVIAAQVKNKIINKVTVSYNGQTIDFFGKYFIDASDTGYFLPMVEADYVIGRDDAKDTDRDDVQAITWVAAIEYDRHGKHRIEKPQDYDFFSELTIPYTDKKVLSWYGHDKDRKARLFGMFGWPLDADGRVIPSLFSYRKIINKKNYSVPVNDVTLINWPQNDYFLGSLYQDEEYHKFMAKELTKSLVYWLQTAAPRHDGGSGYPEIKLRPDILGTADGFAQAPYIRESRRIKAIRTVTESDLGQERPVFSDTVGIGWYHIDLHLTTKTHRTIFRPTAPFEIPLGALIPVETENLLAGCKNIGTTQITNGCYRLHPIEANVGEAAGAFIAYALELNRSPQEIYRERQLICAFQKRLTKAGFELHWPEDVFRNIKLD